MKMLDAKSMSNKTTSCVEIKLILKKLFRCDAYFFSKEIFLFFSTDLGSAENKINKCNSLRRWSSEQGFNYMQR